MILGSGAAEKIALEGKKKCIIKMHPKHIGTVVWKLIQDHIDTCAEKTFNKTLIYVP